jgi:lipopolysaccharide transport system ATP-binding protein
MRFGDRSRWFKEFYALRNVDVTVNRGETVGILGRNGSGKSTLLQIICGTLQPSSGTLRVGGRIAALLELGAGFNPEFTGRENVFLNGTVLGLTHRQIQQKFDEIVSFADIGDFIDQPVKTYSSGMYVRLAFAVAISTEPQILVVDEALSVGDEAFQRKCFSRIEELKRGGATILFVSHSAGSIIELCDKAILMDNGEMLLHGRPKDVVSQYQRLLYAPASKRAMIRQAIKDMELSQEVVTVEHDELLAKTHDAKRFVSNIEHHDLSDMERFDEGMRSESVVEYTSLGAMIIDPHLVNDAGNRVNILVPGREYAYRYRVAFSKTLLKGLSG